MKINIHLNDGRIMMGYHWDGAIDTCLEEHDTFKAITPTRFRNDKLERHMIRISRVKYIEFITAE